MSGKPEYKQDQFEELWFDLNGLTKREWDELMAIARDLIINQVFDGDSFKCTVGALVLYVSEGKGLRCDESDDGEWMN